jgi:predicted ABC-type ATPase
MSTKRMRIFAGPNGSGKTTLVNKLKSEIPFGVYVNADDIEKTLNINKKLSFDQFQIDVTDTNLKSFFKEKSISATKKNINELLDTIEVINNVFSINAKIDSYLAADISEFIRNQLLLNDISFTYETVMSHYNKIEFLKVAQKSGYKVYLYFIGTEDPEININRVGIRVLNKGHNVLSELIKNRYYRSLNNLKYAIEVTNRAYIFDNSKSIIQLVAEITDGKDVSIIDTNNVPQWFIKAIND